MEEHAAKRVGARLLEVLRRIDDVLVLGGSACCVSRSYRDLDAARERAGDASGPEGATAGEALFDADRPAPA